MGITRILRKVGDYLAATPLSNSTHARNAYLFVMESLAGDEYTWVEYRGNRIYGRKREHVIEKIRTGTEFESTTADAIERHVEAGDTVFDVGSQWGIHLFTMSSAAGADGRAFGFEPVPDHCAAIRRSIEENAASNVTLVPKGCGNEHTTKEIAIQGHGSGTSSFLTEKITHSEVETVEMIRLDGFMAEHGNRHGRPREDRRGRAGGTRGRRAGGTRSATSGR